MKRFYSALLLAILAVFTANASSVTFYNSGNWDTVYAYTWSTENGTKTEQLGAWPGTAMTSKGDGLYTIEISDATPQYIIFNNNNNGSQTSDLTFNDGATYTADGESALKFYANINDGGWKTYDLTNGSYEFTVSSTTYFTFTNGVNSNDYWIGAWRPATSSETEITGNVTYSAGGSNGVWKITTAGTYTVTPNAANNSFKVTGYPVYILGVIGTSTSTGTTDNINWDPSQAIKYNSANNGVYTWENIFVYGSADGYGYFSFTTALGSSSSDWTTVNDSERYGAASENAALTETATVVSYKTTGTIYSWKVASALYNVYLDLNNMQVTLGISTLGVESVEVEAADTPVYYDLRGIRVDNPENGIFIEVRGGKAAKVVK